MYHHRTHKHTFMYTHAHAHTHIAQMNQPNASTRLSNGTDSEQNHLGAQIFKSSMVLLGQRQRRVGLPTGPLNTHTHPTHAHTPKHTRTHPNTHAHTHPNTYTHTQPHTRTHTPKHTPKQHTHAHTHPNTHTHTHPNTHTHTHPNTHHAHIHRNTHTHNTDVSTSPVFTPGALTQMHLYLCSFGKYRQGCIFPVLL